MKKSVYEIKKEIEEFCKKRDERDRYHIGGHVKKPMRGTYTENRDYFIRKGREVKRERLKDE